MIIYAMLSQTKQIMEETVGNDDVITSKVTEVSGGNSSNLMDIYIEQEEYDTCNHCFEDFFDEKEPYLKQKENGK